MTMAMLAAAWVLFALCVWSVVIAPDHKCSHCERSYCPRELMHRRISPVLIGAFTALVLVNHYI